VPALLLEAMQDKHRFRKFHRINGAIRAALIIFDDFKNARTTEALELA
jgi:hypothetical protein